MAKLVIIIPHSAPAQKSKTTRMQPLRSQQTSHPSRHSMYKALRNDVFITGILLLAAFARLFLLGGYLPGCSADEASIAYDAYSILRTGKDHYGSPFPIYAQGFNTWGSGLHCYLVAPSIALFGLNEFAARLPAAFLGILTVWFTYLVVKRRLDSSVALWAALLLAVAPWHVHLCRNCTEISLEPFFLMLSLYLFFLGIEQKGLFLPLSAASFALAFYTYYPSRIFVPLTAIGALFIYRSELLRRKGALLAAIVAAFLVLLPTFVFIIREPQHFFLRYRQIELTAGGRTAAGALLLFFKNYFTHLSPLFLFLKGDANVRNAPQGFGQLYLFELPLVVVGIIACIRSWKNPDARFLIFWLLTYPIPASLTTEGIPHATRTVTAIPLYHILSAIGIQRFQRWTSKLAGIKRRLGRIGLCLFLVFAIANVCIFFHHYFSRWRIYTARWLDYGWREAMEYAIAEEGKYDRIVLTVLSIGPPTMFPPFYLRYDPGEYQRSELKKSKYQFVTPDVMQGLFYTLKGRTLYVVREEELRGAAPKKIIYFPDGGVSFKIIEQVN